MNQQSEVGFELKKADQVDPVGNSGYDDGDDVGYDDDDNGEVLECKAPYMPTTDLHTCEVNYKNDTSYYPSINVLKPYLTSNAQEYIHSIQFGENCDKIEFHLIAMPHFGVGSSIKHASKMFGAHWANGIGVIYGNNEWRYGDGLCHNKSIAWSCFLSPLTNCKLNPNVVAWVYNEIES